MRVPIKRNKPKAVKPLSVTQRAILQKVANQSAAAIQQIKDLKLD